MTKEAKANDFEANWKKEQLIDELFPINQDMTDKELYEWSFKREGARSLFEYLIDNNVDLISILNL